MLHRHRYSVAMEEDKITNELLSKLSFLIKSHNEAHPMETVQEMREGKKTVKWKIVLENTEYSK